jgi:hypothetical protein
MKERIFIHSIVFRLVYPLVTGLIAYLVVLMVFDSLARLGDNFFSQEALILVLIAYLQSELFVLFIRLLNSRLPFEPAYRVRVLAQFTGSVVLSIILTSSILMVYFHLVFGSIGFFPEMVVINLVFTMIAIFYHLYYLSIHYLYRHKDLVFQQELEIRRNLEIEREAFLNEINPNLLFSCLESLISLVHTDTKKADDYIGKLSRQYRYFLDSKKNELVPLSEEVGMAHNLVDLMNLKYSGAIHLDVPAGEERVSGQVVPGTLSVLIEDAATKSIVNAMQPLHMELQGSHNESILFSYPVNDSLLEQEGNPAVWKALQASYGYYASKTLEVQRAGNRYLVEIPLLQVMDD